MKKVYNYINRNSKRYKRIMAAIAECEKYADWFSEECGSDAQTAIANFFNLYRQTKPDKSVVIYNGRNYYSYMINTLLFREAFHQGLYCRACNELVSIARFEPILQNRIYRALMAVYYEKLEE